MSHHSLVSAIVLFTTCLRGMPTDAVEPDSRRILTCGSRTALVEISTADPAGRIEWSHPANTREGWVLPDGNILLALSKAPDAAGGAAIEIKRGQDGRPDEVVWRYDGTQKEINSIQKTPQGTYVLSEAGPKPRLLEVKADGTIAVEFPLDCQRANAHMQTRMARKQADGTFLVPHLLDFAIRNYDATGKVLATIDTHVKGEPAINSWPFTAIAVADGGILAGLTNGNRVVEYDRDGAVRWEITTAEVGGAIADACGIQRLPNGNTMIASYHIGQGGVRLLEVTPEKQVVWKWMADVPPVHHFQVVSIDGEDLPWPPLR